VNASQLSVSGVLQFLPGARVAPVPFADLTSGGMLHIATRTGDPDVEITTLQLFEGKVRVDTDRELYVRQALQWTAGTLEGAGRTIVSQANITQPEAQLTLQGFGSMRLDGHELRVLGASSWQAGDVLAGNGAVFVTSGAGFGSGIFQALGNDTFDGNALGGVAATFVNDGIVRKSGGTGTTTIEACYQQEPGALIEELSGTVSITQLCPP
jgi:hypothetical protein